MKLGKVTGAIWATRKVGCLQGQILLVVRLDEGETVAADCVGAGTGDMVLVTFGSAAARSCAEAVDAAIVAIIDKKKE